MVSIMVSLIKGCGKQGGYRTKAFQGLSCGNHFERLTVATMTWLTVTEYPCQKWSHIYSVCRNHNLVLSSLTTYYWVCNKSTTTGATRCVVTAYTSGAPEFTGFSGAYVARSLVFCVLFCSSLFSPFFLFVCSLCCLFFELCF